MFDPETKHQSATWLSPNKLRMQILLVKTMLTAFFYAERIIYHKFVLEKKGCKS
jgi:hypothetical protein